MVRTDPSMGFHAARKNPAVFIRNFIKARYSVLHFIFFIGRKEGEQEAVSFFIFQRWASVFGEANSWQYQQSQRGQPQQNGEIQAQCSHLLNLPAGTFIESLVEIGMLNLHHAFMGWWWAIQERSHFHDLLNYFWNFIGRNSASLHLFIWLP